MHIKRITVGINLFGNPIHFKYLAYVRQGLMTNTFYPIGREIRYYIHTDHFTTYHELPIIIYHRDHNLEIFEETKFKQLLEHFSRQLIALGMKEYMDQGTQINYIDQEPIVNWDPRTTALVRGKTPKQDVIRALIDISDQLFDHNPRSDVKLIFYLKGKYKNYILKDTPTGQKPRGIAPAGVELTGPFYIEQTVTFMQYKYDEKDLIFFNNTVGYFKYNITTGKITTVLIDSFKDALIEKFMLNYPDAKPEVEIYTMVIEPNLNYRSIIFN